MSVPLHDALHGEMAREPRTADELARAVNRPRADVRSALDRLCWDEKRAMPDGSGRWAPATPAQVMALRSA